MLVSLIVVWMCAILPMYVCIWTCRKDDDDGCSLTGMNGCSKDVCSLSDTIGNSRKFCNDVTEVRQSGVVRETIVQWGFGIAVSSEEDNKTWYYKVG